jgi:hypothetical protein
LVEADEKLLIWGAQIPYNTGESKLEVMALTRKPRFAPVAVMQFAKVIGSTSSMMSTPSTPPPTP